MKSNESPLSRWTNFHLTEITRYTVIIITSHVQAYVAGTLHMFTSQQAS